MDSTEDQEGEIQWGLESFIPSLQQLKGEAEFPDIFEVEFEVEIKIKLIEIDQDDFGFFLPL